MDIPQETEALKSLPPQKYTIRILVIAVSFLVAGYPTIWGIMNNKVEEKETQVRQCMTEKQQMSEQRRIEEMQKAEERIRQSEQDKRKADSILNIVLVAQSNIKKAINNEKKK
jgi:ABC-type lipoprotein release transport system permease subunit